MQLFAPKHLCWRPDIPDFRDLLPDSPEILHLLPPAKLPNATLPVSVNLSEYLLGCTISSSAAACPSSIVCVKLVEYFEYRCTGRLKPLCAQFVTRTLNALGQSDCSGIRANLKAIRRFGIPPDSIVQASNAHLDSRLPPILFAYADEFRSMHYVRIGCQCDASSPVRSLKVWLASGFPMAFGFSVPSSLEGDGYIEYRPTFDSIQGGAAALLVGYDDQQLAASKGAFRVFCPWGSAWGDQGFGWLPYTFVERRMALDFWTILQPKWVESGELFRAT